MYANVLSTEELDYLNNRPEVLRAKAALDSKRMVYFSLPITNKIRDTLKSRFDLNLSVDSQIPMRWIKGDTAPHIDVGASKFQNTYLLYINDSPGNFVIDSQAYPIQANTGFVFNEGVSHETQYTENVPRLLLGPMNELAEPVGVPTPPPPPPTRFFRMVQSLYSDNSRVYYKPNSLSWSSGSTVRNSRAKARRT